MSIDISLTDLMSGERTEEARRQIEICNACRYCEGYCSAFPAITRLREFNNGDVTQIANLCHNCRGCYYACQYTAPHEFNINLPRALAEVRTQSWETYIWPSALARAFHTHAWATIAATVLGFAALFIAIRTLGATSGDGFYAVLSHSAMVAIFLPAFVIPIFAIAIGLFRYWRAVGGKAIRLKHIVGAFHQAATMKNLAGGHDDGCNFEAEDRFTHKRRYAHQIIMYGFLLCFASTSVATLMHYVLDIPAPYGLSSLPKALGIPGGIMLAVGCAWMLILKRQADGRLSDASTRSADNAFVALLGFVGFSGLVLYAATGYAIMPLILAIHLGAVLSFFLLTPFTKMAHGFFRLTALVRDEQLK